MQRHRGVFLSLDFSESNKMKEINQSQLSTRNKIPEKNQEVAQKKKLETDEYVLAGLGLAGVLAIGLKAVLNR